MNGLGDEMNCPRHPADTDTARVQRHEIDRNETKRNDVRGPGLLDMHSPTVSYTASAQPRATSDTAHCTAAGLILIRLRVRVACRFATHDAR